MTHVACQSLNYFNDFQIAVLVLWFLQPLQGNNGYIRYMIQRLSSQYYKYYNTCNIKKKIKKLSKI